jgi:hypothetical protein
MTSQLDRRTARLMTVAQYRLLVDRCSSTRLIRDDYGYQLD